MIDLMIFRSCGECFPRFPRKIRAGTTIGELEAVTLMSSPVADPAVEASERQNSHEISFDGVVNENVRASKFPQRSSAPQSVESVVDSNFGSVSGEKSHRIRGVLSRDAASRIRSTSSVDVSEDSTPKFIEQLIDDVDPATPESSVLSLQGLLLANRHVFSESEYDLGSTDVVESSIVLIQESKAISTAA